MKNKKIFKMSFLAMMSALLLIMMFTPVGYVPVGVLRITTMHIPVIITALILGKKSGMFIGLIFGLTSIIINTLQPTITSFVFSPFVKFGGMGGNGYSLIIAIVPRVLMGLVAVLVYDLVSKKVKNETIAVGAGAMLGTLTNTILVLGMIYVFFGQSYALARGIDYSLLVGVLMTTVLTNGILEIIIAVLASVVIVKILKVRR